MPRAPRPPPRHARPPPGRAVRAALLLLTIGSLKAARIPHATQQLKILCQEHVSKICWSWPLAVGDVGLAERKLHRAPPQYSCGITDFKISHEHSSEILVSSASNDITVTTCKRTIQLPMHNINEWSLDHRRGSRQRRQVSYRGKFRGQTQSQYLAIDQGGNKDEGKAEAISAADTSKAIVSGRSGMGQAQSQSMYDPSCDECIDRYLPGAESLRRPTGPTGVNRGSGGELPGRTPLNGDSWNSPGARGTPGDNNNWNTQSGIPSRGTNWNDQGLGGGPGGPGSPTGDRSNGDTQRGPQHRGEGTDGPVGGSGKPITSGGGGPDWNTQGGLPGNHGGGLNRDGGGPNDASTWNTQSRRPAGLPEGRPNWNTQGRPIISPGGETEEQGYPQGGANTWNTPQSQPGHPEGNNNWNQASERPSVQGESNWNTPGGVSRGRPAGDNNWNPPDSNWNSQRNGPGGHENLPDGSNWNTPSGNTNNGNTPPGSGNNGNTPGGNWNAPDGRTNWNTPGGSTNWNTPGGRANLPGGTEGGPSGNNNNHPSGEGRRPGSAYFPPFFGKDWSVLTGSAPGVPQGSTYFCCVVGPNPPQYIGTGSEGNIGNGYTGPTIFNLPNGQGGGHEGWAGGQGNTPDRGWNGQGGDMHGIQGGSGGQGGPIGGWNGQGGGGPRNQGDGSGGQVGPSAGGWVGQGGVPGDHGGGLGGHGGPSGGGWNGQGVNGPSSQGGATGGQSGSSGVGWNGQGGGPGGHGGGLGGQGGPSGGVWSGQGGGGPGNQGGSSGGQGGPSGGGWNGQGGGPGGHGGGLGGQNGPSGGGWNGQVGGGPGNQGGGLGGQGGPSGGGWNGQGNGLGGHGGGSGGQGGPSGGRWDGQGGGGPSNQGGSGGQGGSSGGGWTGPGGGRPGSQGGDSGGHGGPSGGGWNGQGVGPSGHGGGSGGQGGPSGGGWNGQGGGGPGNQGSGPGGNEGPLGGGWNGEGGGGQGGPSGGRWNGEGGGGPDSQGVGSGGQGGPSGTGWNGQGGGGPSVQGSGGQGGPSGGGWNGPEIGPGGHGEGSGGQGGPSGGQGGPSGGQGGPSGGWNGQGTSAPGSQRGTSGGQGGPSGGNWNGQGGDRPGNQGGGSGGPGSPSVGGVPGSEGNGWQGGSPSGGWNGQGGGGPGGQGGSGGQTGTTGGGWNGQVVGSGNQGGNGEMLPGSNGIHGPPQNVIDPNSITAEGDDSQAESSITQNANGTLATAASNGGNNKGRAKTQVSGTYAGSGTFSAQAEISDESKGAQSEVSGGKHGAISIAQGHSRNSKSQANVNLGSETGSLTSGAQSDGVMHSSNTQVQGGVKGGSAEAQARGPGSTSSQAQIGFTPFNDSDRAQHDLFKTPFVGSGKASSHSNGRIGESQSQLEGTFKYGIKYTGAAQSGASLDKDAVFANRQPFNKIDVFDKNDKNIDVDNTETPPDVTPLPLPDLNDVQNKIINSTEKPQGKSGGRLNDHSHLDHHMPTNDNRANSVSPPPGGNTRSFQPSYANNNADFDFTSDKEDIPPEDYDADGGLGPEGNDPVDEDYSYDEFGKDTETHQSLHTTSRKSFEIKQSTGGNTQHIVLGTLNDQDAIITQRNTDQKPDESRIYQPGESVPGTGGYTIPAGFTGSIKSVASKQNTYAIGSRRSPSQAQTVSLSPGSGKVKYVYPNVTPYGKYVAPKNLRSYADNNKDDNNRYVSVSKTVTGALDNENNIRKQYSHTYYTKSSSCGYFTFTCTMVSGPDGRKKVCKPKIPTNPDGTPMRC